MLVKVEAYGYVRLFGNCATSQDMDLDTWTGQLRYTVFAHTEFPTGHFSLTHELLLFSQKLSEILIIQIEGDLEFTKILEVLN